MCCRAGESFTLQLRTPSSATARQASPHRPPSGIASPTRPAPVKGAQARAHMQLMLR